LFNIIETIPWIPIYTNEVPDNFIYNGSRLNPNSTTMQLKLYKAEAKNEHYKGLKFYHKKNFNILYRYPFKCDSEEYLQQICKFIVDDLSTHVYDNFKKKSNTLYISYVRGQLEFVDSHSFIESEKEYFREHNLFI